MLLAQRQHAPYFMLYAPNKGTVARYHIDTAVIDAALEAIRQSTDGISLSLWLYKGVGQNDMYLDWSGGHLVGQSKTNVQAILAKIKSLNFSFVQVAIEFYGPNDPRQNKYTDQIFDENWLFIGDLQSYMVSAGITNYLIDVCPEFNDVYAANPDFAEYVRDIWTNVTGWFYPGGEPCWAFTMSFIPGNLACLTEAFCGNFPTILLPHLYGSPLGPAAFLQLILDTYDKLAAAGLGDRLIGLGETDTIVLPADLPFAQSLQQAIQMRKIRVVFVAPWQVVPSDAMYVNFSVYPPTGSPQWSGVGA